MKKPTGVNLPVEASISLSPGHAKQPAKHPPS